MLPSLSNSFSNLPYGSIVVAKSNSLGFGKVINLFEASVEVEYFVSFNDRRCEILPIKDLDRVHLPRQTRCYFWSEEVERWQTGRVYNWDDNRYEIDLPNGRFCYKDEQEVYVRCNIPLADPTEVLISKGHEAPFFHSYRSAFIQNLIEQRAISHGMPGLLSANISLYRHQVEVVRRVLEDPIQRYLLADEVGLGKTIEAGVILRQFLLDNPKGQALVIVPRALQEQWRQELASKFYLTDEIQLVAAEELCNVEVSLPSFLIIDEAHHIAAMATSTRPSEQKVFALCQQLAHYAKGVLLLSATPALNHEQAFLAMLHLLDPTTYSLDDLEGFKDRIRKRQEIGRVLLSFKETSQPFVLKKGLAKLRDLFPEDNRLSLLLAQLQTQLDSSSTTSSQRDSTVRAIRTHISDTYRLHRRMLRNRRDTVEDVLLDQTNSLLKIEFDNNEQAERLHEYLDEWRLQALGVAEKNSDYWQQLKCLYRVLFLARSSWHYVLEWIIVARLRGQYLNEVANAFGEEVLSLLLDTPHFDNEDEILENLLKIIKEIPEESDLIFQLQNLILKLRREGGFKIQKLVIFTGYSQVASSIAQRLRQEFGDSAIATLEQGQSAKIVAQQEKQFSSNPNCFILVCDASGEEGHNLQFADYMIHFDLPWSPNRLEQRHGRMNRIGLRHVMKYIVFSGSQASDDPLSAWVSLLGDGLKLFKESIASLQFYIDKKLPELETVLFQEGADGFYRMIDVIQDEIVQEKVSIDEQYALDEIDILDSNAAEYFTKLDDYDSCHQQIKRAIEGWICTALHFKYWFTDSNTSDYFFYKKTDRTLLPVNDIFKFLSPEEFQKSGTYNRRLANQRPGTIMYRIGSRMIDSLRDYVQWDDRGRAFALWRHVAEWPSEDGTEQIFFRFDYIVEADLLGIKQLLKNIKSKNISLRALERRCDALFPPFFRTIFLDTQMEIVTNENLLEILNRPYSKKGQPRPDYNLGKNRLNIIDEYISRDYWEMLCRKARTQSEASLRQNEDFLNYCQRYAQTADRKLSERVEQLSLRLAKQKEMGSQQSLTEETEMETELKTAIVEGIINPCVSLDSIGFYIVSGRSPSQLGEDSD